ncbi:hypothetical protein PY365_29275 [Roseiarcaceae bacterium H3SJ34-1]|uniref:hypothetical protein n=1 Tax=Terripilifer ovatus TaxID=3032367 RepID=UPI003AB952CD|nr:hypothetical protein [Roseiarcaceae bacterium H3SJ34-1]
MKMSVAIATFCAAAIAGPALTTGASALPLSRGMQQITIDPMIDQVQFKGKGGGFKGGGGGFKGGGFGGGGRRYYGGGGGFNRGAGVAVGLGVLGLAAAAAAANSAPVYRDCWVERRPITDRWGNYIGTRPIRVCN